MARSVLTTGSPRNTYGGEIINTYEWEISGIINGIEKEKLADEVWMISANYKQENLCKRLKLTTFYRTPFGKRTGTEIDFC